MNTFLYIFVAPFYAQMQFVWKRKHNLRNHQYKNKNKLNDDSGHIYCRHLR